MSRARRRAPGSARRVVLFDAYPHQYGGAQRTDHLLARGMPAAGWDLTTIVPRDGEFPERLREEGLAVEVVPVPGALDRYGRTTRGLRALVAVLALPAYWFRLARAIGRVGPSVVHVVDHRGLLLAAIPSRLAGARVVWHVQAMDTNPLLNRAGGRLASVVVVPSRAIVGHMPGLEARLRPVVVAPNVVAEPMRRAQPAPLARAPIVVTVGRVHPDKGLDLLIRALAVVRAHHPEARLEIVGGVQEGYEDHRAELERLGAELGVGDAVRFLGPSDEPMSHVAAARLYVQASRQQTETFGMAVLEAMAQGTPVVATDVGGVSDHVRDGETGLLVPPDRVDALAEAMGRSLGSDAEADRLRLAAFELAHAERYTEAALVASFASAYERAAATGRRA